MNMISSSLFKLLKNFLNKWIERTKRSIYEHFSLFFKSFINKCFYKSRIALCKKILNNVNNNDVNYVIKRFIN